jgi:ATP-dependent Lon protease
LDADHHGLDDVKDRIVEYLAIRARRAERGLEVVGGRGSGAVMALVGRLVLARLRLASRLLAL